MSLHSVPAMRIASASKSFNRRTLALDGVGALIQAGECIGLLGASGSGKSTLLRSICGLERQKFHRKQIGNLSHDHPSPCV